MAISQRYAGKILTPWFDIAEWKATKVFIHSESIESQQFALDRLKVWKLRTPLLSVGIEGTLILLEALLEKQMPLSEYEISQIFSTALLRFLNICAASNERQGTFYKTAEKNDLPYWLITLRHDIAHDHKVPTKAILECALNECFKWIKKKYWEVQDLHMKDYIVTDETNYKELIYDYAQLNLLCFLKENTCDLIASIKNKFEDIIPGDLDHEVAPYDFMLLLEDFVLQSVTKDTIKDSSIHIVSTLVEKQIILSVNLSLVNGVKKIPANFIQIWLRIINLLYQNGTVFLLINKLGDITESDIYEHSVKEIASLWIAELYCGFMKTKKMKEELESVQSLHSEELDPKTAHLILRSVYDKDTITFYESEWLPIEDSKSFQERILRKPNTFTLNYLELVLSFNGNKKEFIKEQCKQIRKLVQLNTSLHIYPDCIHTVKELQQLYNNNRDNDMEIDFKEVIFLAEKVQGPMKRLKKLTDSEKFRFKGYPLGLLPPNPS